MKQNKNKNKAGTFGGNEARRLFHNWQIFFMTPGGRIQNKGAHLKNLEVTLASG